MKNILISEYNADDIEFNSTVNRLEVIFGYKLFTFKDKIKLNLAISPKNNEY